MYVFLYVLYAPCRTPTAAPATPSRSTEARRDASKPIRSKAYPHGFPWLTGELKDKAALGSTLVLRCVEVLEIAPKSTVCAWEHPEDLGRARNGVPAQEKRNGDYSFLNQCEFGADYLKPTRLLSDAHGVLAVGHPGWPTFNKEDYYMGPLPRSCGHSHPPLIGTQQAGGFKTGPTAAYPPGMNQMLAKLLFEHWYNKPLTPSEGRDSTRTSTRSSTIAEADRKAEDPSKEEEAVGTPTRPSICLEGAKWKALTEQGCAPKATSVRPSER